jgi:hypothetical protein
VPTPEEPPPYRPAPVRATDDEAPLYQAERARLAQERLAYREAPAHPPPSPVAGATEQPQATAPAAAQPADRLTQAGLPRRVPRANLAPGMATDQARGEQPAPGSPPSGRSPDEVRSMLSSYRTGIERGRSVAGGSDSGERPPDAP